MTQTTLRNGSVVDAVDPADFEETLLQLGLATSGPRVRDDSGRSPRCRRTVAHRAPRVRDDSGRSPRSRRTVARRALSSPIVPHRVLESAIFSLSHRVLLARAGHRSCRPWSSKKFHYKSSCACTWTVKVHNISKDRWPVSQPKFLTSESGPK